MTRLLSRLLDAREPAFRLSLMALERAAGEPSEDIRLSAEIVSRSRAKIRELGLDPNDTTGMELYAATAQRLKHDDELLRRHLGLDQFAGSIAELTAAKRLVGRLAVPLSCYALKPSAGKKLFKEQPPKRSLSVLGYRSLDSMLKHEPLAQIYTAAMLYESRTWQKSFLGQYDRLRPGDFESRPISFTQPTSKYWQKIARDFSADQNHIIRVVRELGSVVILPVDINLPALTLTATLLMLEAVNEVRCASAFLKLRQVKADFAQAVKSVAYGEPLTSAKLAGQVLPWRVWQHYYERVKGSLYSAVFEPHIQPEDLELARGEAALAAELPELSFWQDCRSLALLDNGRPVSLNMLDVAINVANGLPFAARAVYYLQSEVWQELMMRYLNPALLEQAIDQLENQPVSPALVTEEV